MIKSRISIFFVLKVDDFTTPSRISFMKQNIKGTKKGVTNPNEENSDSTACAALCYEFTTLKKGRDYFTRNLYPFFY